MIQEKALMNSSSEAASALRGTATSTRSGFIDRTRFAASCSIVLSDCPATGQRVTSTWAPGLSFRSTPAIDVS